MEKMQLLTYGFFLCGIIFSWFMSATLRIKSPIFLSGPPLHSLIIMLVLENNLPEAALFISASIYPLFGIFLSKKNHNQESIFYLSRKASYLCLVLIALGIIATLTIDSFQLIIYSPIVYLFYTWNILCYIKLTTRSISLANKSLRYTAILTFILSPSFTAICIYQNLWPTNYFLLLLIINTFISLTTVILYLKKHYAQLSMSVLNDESLYRKNLSVINANKILNERLIALKNKALNNQTNPHFLFNSINSVNSLIIKSEIEKAELYLNNLTQFFQLTFSDANSSLYTLSEEFDLLKLYLSLENLRRDNPINLVINNPKENHLNEYYVPRLFFQSIIENSILHGISEKSDGRIEINLEHIKDYIKVEIKDNGNGISNSHQKHQHKSAGLEILENRLKSLEEYFLIKCSLEIISKNDLGGTTVIVIFPVIISPPKLSFLPKG